MLGWLLTRTHPRASLVVTAALTFAGVLWALAAPGMWFLLSFGIMGAGELFGVYYPNYILSCSPRSHMRRNMAFTSLITMPVGFASILFGFISDSVGAASGSKRFGYQMSFVASLGLLVVGIILVRVLLPKRPRPPEVMSDE
jgi:MFS family permease